MAQGRTLPMFPLSTVLFPGAGLPLHVFEPRYREMTDHCLAGDGEFGVVLIARGSEVGGGDQRYGVGTVAHIEEASRFDDGRWALVAEGRRRITVVRWLADDPYPQAEVADLPEETGPADEEQFARATAAVRRVRTLLSELGAPAPVLADLGAGAAGDDDDGDDHGDDDGGWRLWRLCAAAPLTALDGQRVLETAGPGARLTLLTELCDALAGDLSQLLGRGGGA